MRHALADAVTMTRRNLTHVARDPAEVALYIALPVMMVLVFGYVFGSGMAVPGGGNYREFLLPGVFVMTMLYGVGATATSIATDAGRGVIDRFRSLPVSRAALVVGRSLADLLRATLELSVLVCCGLLVGWQWHNRLTDTLLGLALIILLRFALTWVGIVLGLAVRDPDLVGVIVFPIAFPLTAVSNVFVSPELMPGWLGTAAQWNPLSATVAAARELFGNPGVPASGGWPGEHPLVLAVAWPALLIAVFFPLAVRGYRRLGR